MQIFINGKEISFTLEQEKKLSHVIKAITEEIKKYNATIISVLVNNKTNSSYDMDLSDVEVIHIEADNDHIAFLHQCEIAQAYLKTLIDCIQRSKDITVSFSDLKNYNIHKEDIVHFATHIDEYCFTHPLPQRPIKNIFLQIIMVCSFFEEKLTYNEFAESVLYTIIDLIEKQIVRVCNPKEYSKAINEMMIKRVPEIEKISEIINTGKEELAVNYIIVSTDIIRLWIDALAEREHSVNGTTNGKQEVSEEWEIAHKTFVNEFQEFLVECANALEAKDWVTVGDLMEYEIAPRIKAHTEYAKNYYSSEYRS